MSRRGDRFNEPVPTTDIDVVIADPLNLVWADIDSPTPQDFQVLRDEFGFHELALEDASKMGQRPKLETYTDHCFMVLYAVTFDEHELTIDEHELDIFVGHNYIVTVHHGPIPELEEVAHRWESNAQSLQPSIGVLLYSLIDAVIDGYQPVLDAIAEQTDIVEARIFDEFHPGAQELIFRLRKELLNLRRVLVPERDVLLQLARRELLPLDHETQAYFQDVYDHVVRATDSTDLYRELLNGALDSYLSLSSNNLNVVFRTLTSVSIILMSLSLIAGIYGMNFDNMPELRTRYGYFVVLLIMASVAGALYVVFNRKRWL